MKCITVDSEAIMDTLFIAWALGNFSLFMFLVAVVLIVLNRLCCCRKHSCSEASYRYMAFFALGLTSLYSFVMHAFFPGFTASVIGWHTSPFQFEVAMANLAIGIVAVLSVWRGQGFRWAIVIAATIWLWGDALGHIQQMIMHHDYAAGNAGSWFYMDVLIPVVLLMSLCRSCCHNKCSTTVN